MSTVCSPPRSPQNPPPPVIKFPSHPPPQHLSATASRRILPILAEQFVECGPPTPSEAGPRGAGLEVATAAHALAGMGLVAGEKGVGRRRAAAAAAGHAAVLADVARRMPLTFLEQVRVLLYVCAHGCGLWREE